MHTHTHTHTYIYIYIDAHVYCDYIISYKLWPSLVFETSHYQAL